MMHNFFNVYNKKEEMNTAAMIASLLLISAISVRQFVKVVEEEGFVDYMVIGPGRGPWYGGRWRYQPHWGYNRRYWWNNLYDPAPWGPCPGPWCPYR